MSVEVTCKKCGNRLRASDKYAGWRVQCPQCSAMNQFPAMGEPLPDTNDASPVSKAPAASADMPVQAKPLPVPSQTPANSIPASPTNSVPTLAGARRCTLCDRPISVNDMAQDTEGKIYHRRCYDRERARRLAATVRQQGTPSRSVQPKPPATKPAAPAAKPAAPATKPAAPVWTPPTTPTSRASAPGTPDRTADDVLRASSPSGASAHEEVLADSSLLVPLPDLADSVVPADDLWADPSLPSVAADTLGPAPIYEPPVRLSQGMYTLIGVGAAMPILAILAIVVYSLTRTTSAPPLPPSSTAQSVAPSVLGVPPVGSSPAPIASSPGAAAAVAANLPVWQPDPALMEQLGPYQDFDAYQIRVPKGYEPVHALTPAPPPGVTARAWAGAPRPDGTRGSVTLMLFTPPPHEAAMLTLPNLMERMMAVGKTRYSDWSQGPVELGQVNGLQFSRSSWHGTAPHVSGRVFGLDYAGKNGTTFIQIRSQDVEAYQEQALKLGTAAILTFRRK